MPESPNTVKVRLSNSARREGYRIIADHLAAQGVEVTQAAVLSFALNAGAQRIRQLTSGSRAE